MAEENKSDIRAQILADMAAKDREAGFADPLPAKDEPKPDDNSPTPSPKDEEEGKDEKPVEGDEPSKDEDNKEAEGEKPEGEEKPDDKKESKYKKAQRGRERLEEIRKKAEEEKEAARKEREAAEAAREETRRAIAEAQSRAHQKVDTVDGRFSAEEFERAADYYEQEAEKAVEAGDMEAYHKNLAESRTCRRAAKQVSYHQRQAAEQKAYAEFTAAYKGNAEKVLKDHPEIQDPESGIWPEMQKVIESYDILTRHPDGFQYAYEIVTSRRAHGERAGLLEENKKLKEENKRLKQLETPEAGDFAAGPPKGDGFDKASPEKKREIVRAQMEKADGLR